MSFEDVKKLAEDLGGEIKEAGILPDNSGFAVMSMPLPKDHWLTKEGFNVPPMPMRMGTESILVHGKTRQMWAEELRAAGRYAVRCATMNGKENDFDPDALIQCLVVGFLGYWTPDGLSSDAWANPAPSEKGGAA